MHPVKIAIASVLKPLKDPRSYYKFALSLRETNKYQINIIGFYSKKETDEELIKFHPLFYKKRNSFARLNVSIRLLKLLRKIRPKSLIVTTYELLPAALLGKCIFRYKLVYDIQENYALNFRLNNSKHILTKQLGSLLIKFIEFSSRPFTDHFIFAEKCYVTEFPKIKNHTVLENKYQGPKINSSRPFKLGPSKLNFLLCGTLAEIYGSMDALLWFDHFHRHFPDSTLKILGHAPLESFRTKLLQHVQNKPYLEFTISSDPISYEEILEAYQSADMVLLPYRQTKNISPKIPSKLYECLALKKAFLFSPNAKWQSLAEKYNAGIAVDFKSNKNYDLIAKSIFSKVFYDNSSVSEAHWLQEKQSFLQVIEHLFTKDQKLY
ncbi:hypothetical protein [Arthrospiribacter ruber]|uniref:Uncharacterized protein n=1 Tax=Arthrospiribacter ruber TaxID=2487934 RepID=A0A951IZ27_9BACT|nr:hypothetical protein [Arthrospiribacter ruber]MBW3468143.1 hypothetical protein [Arthrospiribacter ruber]